MTALSPVWLDSRSRYLRDMYRPGMVMEQWNPETRSHDRYVTGIFSRRSMPVILLCWAFWLCDWYDAGADSAY